MTGKQRHLALFKYGMDKQSYLYTTLCVPATVNLTCIICVKICLLSVPTTNNLTCIICVSQFVYFQWEGRVHRVLTDKLVAQYGDSLDPNRGPFTRTFNTIQAKVG